MLINWALKEISIKIVYYGPGLSGKTTNLENIYQKIDPARKSKLVSLKTKEERTIFFDFMQFDLPPIQGKRPKFSLYTVPGQHYYAASRRVILNGADGIVFVADSQKHRLTDNLDSILDLEENLIRQNRSLEQIPWVLQSNKRDMEDTLPIETLHEKLNYHNVPHFSAVATEGIEVSETLKSIIQNVLSDIQRKINA